MHWDECGTGSLRIKDVHETHSYHVWSAVEMRMDAVVGVQKSEGVKADFHSGK